MQNAHPHRSDDQGFSLVELLVVSVILGALAAISLPTFLNHREKGYVATVESDLRNAASAQEAWAVEHAGTYAASADALVREGYTPSEGVEVEVESVDANGYCLSATHPNLPGPVYYSPAEGAATETSCA